MTNQPTVADAVRLMDSLSLFPSPTTSSPHLGANTGYTRDSTPAAAEHGPLYMDRDKESIGNDQRCLDRSNLHDKSSSTAPSLGAAASSLISRGVNQKESVSIPNLPAEIVFQIATHLTPTPSIHLGTDGLDSASFSCRYASVLYTGPATLNTGLSSLLSLSSASRSFRNTLIPLIWHTIVIRTPQHLPRLSALLKSYDTLNVRSASPSSVRKRISGLAYPAEIYERDDRGVEGEALRHPLPHIRSIIVAIPDKYMDLDQTFLLTLLRSMHLPHTRQLEHLYWSAEAVPNPAIWPLLGPSLKSLEVDGRAFYQGHRSMAGLERLERLKMIGYESTLLPSGAVAVFQAQRRSEIDAQFRGIKEVPEGAGKSDGGRRGESPLATLQRSTINPRRQAQHLYPDQSSSNPIPSLPPTMNSISRTRLKYLSLSSSKTSLLHQPSLIHSGAFQGLVRLDLFAVTPEPPLSAALISAGETLSHLRLVLDISGAFANFNALWADLTDNLLHLVSLDLDPMPQQNTAPSFWDFVESCPKLEWINGRKVGSFPPCFGGFDPSHPSGALPF